MSIFDASAEVSMAPSWRCPHCRTLQAEALRCWRCLRAAVTCSTCHRFRTSVASDLGYCAADSSRTPLRGDEARPCWEAAPEAPTAPGLFDTGTPPPAPPTAAPTRPRRQGPAPAPKPSVEDVRAAAWVEAPDGQLVEAPSVAPRQTVMSEVQRRRRSRSR